MTYTNTNLSNKRKKSISRKQIRSFASKDFREVKIRRGRQEAIYFAVKDSAFELNYDKEAVDWYKKSLESYSHQYRDKFKEDPVPAALSYMINVACNEVIRLYESDLPDSYNVLKVIHKLHIDGKIEEEIFKNLVHKQLIHPEISVDEVVDLFNG